MALVGCNRKTCPERDGSGYVFLVTGRRNCFACCGRGEVPLEPEPMPTYEELGRMYEDALQRLEDIAWELARFVPGRATKDEYLTKLRYAYRKARGLDEAA